MPLNPVLREETLDSPIQRANPLNDPQFANQQGYNNYDLTNNQLLSPRYGEVTPCTVFETVPGDRHTLRGNALSILNQIDSNLVTAINVYTDYFYVPMRVIYPVNYEKIIPNPTKGDDIPAKALPMIPLFALLRDLIYGDQYVNLTSSDEDIDDTVASVMVSTESHLATVFQINQLAYLTTIISRGQLLDYLGISLDTMPSYSRRYERYRNYLQKAIDDWWNALAAKISYDIVDGKFYAPRLSAIDTFSNDRWHSFIDINDINSSYSPSQRIVDGAVETNYSLSALRAFIYDTIERGHFISFEIQENLVYNGNITPGNNISALPQAETTRLLSILRTILYPASFSFDETNPDPFDSFYVNPCRIAAYQLSVAEYMSNDSVDNLFTAQLYMQNMRAIMFPSVDGITSEPTFDYNGVATEYDLFTTGAFEKAWFDTSNSSFVQRVLPFLANFLIMRRSLRYGDYFATARPQLLANGQLGIPVDSDGMVRPLDVTKNLVLQRFLNAVNWVGSRFVNYMTSIFGVKPQLTDPHPVFIAHRKTPLQREFINNTADNQGKQVTNLKGETDNHAFDVFIDDFGVIIGVLSFDALPAYPSGIDRNYHNGDRYSIFNAMLQNVGDQPVLVSELTGVLGEQGDLPFGYSVRYAEYKFGITRAHGAFVNSLPGYAMIYPWTNLDDGKTLYNDVRINPDFIRDKPFFFDQFFASRSGFSPAEYYHFIVSVQNEHHAARKMQYQPPVL